MLLNLAYVRETLWTYADQTVDYSVATQDQKDEADGRINQVTERILGDGKYKNTIRRITVPIQNGYVTCPREIGTLLGIKVITDSDCCCTSQIYSKFHEFAHSTSCCSMGTYPISETAQTFLVPDAPFTLRVKSISGASGSIRFIGGWDENEEEIFTTDTVSITNGTTNGTFTYSSLPPSGGIQKDTTTVPVELYSVDGDGNETLIAVYAPYETIPAYKKYKVPYWNGQFTSALLFGKLAYFPAVNDTDIVIPSNLGALKMGLKALQSEDTEEDEHAEQDWARCFRILDKEVIETDSDAEFPVMRVEYGFGCEGVHNLV